MNEQETMPDIISIGECLVELSREPDGRYRAAWAGDMVNALFYGGRLGMRTGFVTSFGDDLFTPMIRDGIMGEGIDCGMAEVVPGRNNGLYAIELDGEGEYTFHFWRKDSAATMTLLRCDPDNLFRYCTRASWLLFSGITLAVLKGRERLIELLSRLRKTGRTKIAFDTNYRPALWASAGEYDEAFREIIPFVDLLLPSESDLAAFRSGEPLEAFLAGIDVPLVALKRGGRGCLLVRNGNPLELPPPEPAVVVDATGAGDAFNGGFLAGLVKGWSPEDAARLGMRVAGRVVGVRGAIDQEFDMQP